MVIDFSSVVLTYDKDLMQLEASFVSTDLKTYIRTNTHIQKSINTFFKIANTYTYIHAYLYANTQKQFIFYIK